MKKIYERIVAAAAAGLWLSLEAGAAVRKLRRRPPQAITGLSA